MCSSERQISARMKADPAKANLPGCAEGPTGGRLRELDREVLRPHGALED
jgi:hypothetical protein